jgi:hypothetical protein
LFFVLKQNHHHNRKTFFGLFFLKEFPFNKYGQKRYSFFFKKRLFFSQTFVLNMSFSCNIEPTTWHAWVELPDGKIIDWNNGMPSKLQVTVHDKETTSKFKKPFEPIYEEVKDPRVLKKLKDQQKEAVKQWVAYSIKRWPKESFIDKWVPEEDQCLINSYFANKKFGGKVGFGKFGWKRMDGSVCR